MVSTYAVLDDPAQWAAFSVPAPKSQEAVPYSDDEIAHAADEVRGKSELCLSANCLQRIVFVD